MAAAPIEVTEEQFRVVKARLGLEAESFQVSHVGRYIYDRIDQDLERFREDLENTDPHDIEKCVEIRNNILVRKLFALWIDEAIGSGLNAERELLEDSVAPDY